MTCLSVDTKISNRTFRAHWRFAGRFARIRVPHQRDRFYFALNLPESRRKRTTRSLDLFKAARRVSVALFSRSIDQTAALSTRRGITSPQAVMRTFMHLISTVFTTSCESSDSRRENDYTREAVSIGAWEFCTGMEPVQERDRVLKFSGRRDAI